MKNHSKPINKLFVVLLALALVFPALNNIKVNAVSAMRTVYTAGFETETDGWGAHYGGSCFYRLTSIMSETKILNIKVTGD